MSFAAKTAAASPAAPMQVFRRRAPGTTASFLDAIQE
jgi:hypothetical protein